MISGWPNYSEFRFSDNDASQFWSCWKLDFVIVDMYSSQPQIQPRTQACSRYPSDQRRLGTERDSARRPGRIFPKSLTGDVTSEIAEDDWERGCLRSSFKSTSKFSVFKSFHEPHTIFKGHLPFTGCTKIHISSPFQEDFNVWTVCSTNFSTSSSSPVFKL